MTYIVKVIKTDYETNEETIFEMEFDEDDLPNDERRACAHALEVCANGCNDED